MKEGAFSYFTLALSVAAHVPLVCAEGSVRTQPLPVQTAFVELAALPTPPLPEPVEVPQEPPPEIANPQPKKTKPKPEPEPPPTEAATPADVPPEPAPPPLTGTTLVSDVGASWSAPAGDGSARDGAIGVGVATQAKPRAPAPKPPAPFEASGVPLAELSRKPLPPPLTRILERHYPPTARRLGQSGEAKVRARIEANGEIRSVRISSETGNGFGAACRAALLESRWSAPLDRHGKPVATWITYRCKFRVDG